MEQRLVLEAVTNERAATPQGAMQRLFARWFDGFVYNQIWEDPRVDIEALELGPDSRILTISSGGCNALNYLLEGPASVTAVDLNRHHIYLLRLKHAAAQYLPRHEDLFAMFGVGKTAKIHDLFHHYIAPHLDDDTQEFWDTRRSVGRCRLNFFERRGLYDHSRNGYFLRFFHAFAHASGCRPERILKARSLEEQAEIFDREIAPFFDKFFIRFVGRLPVTLFGLGIPPQQFRELTGGLDGSRSIIDIYRERVRRLACDFPIEENYFAWQAFARRYDTENRVAVPDYLKEENFEKLRSAAGGLATHVGSVTEMIRSRPRGSFNRFVFLDAQDWMNSDALTDLWSLLADRAEPGSRIIFRTAGAASPVESVLPPELRSRFEYHEDKSSELFLRDRASIYGGFHLYVVK